MSRLPASNAIFWDPLCLFIVFVMVTAMSTVLKLQIIYLGGLCIATPDET